MKEIHEILAVWNAIILAVSTVTRLAGALVWAECICTNSSSIDTIVNSAGTFIDILQECKRKNKKILGVRKLSRPSKECDLSIYGILLILHLVYVFYSDACTDRAFLFFLSTQRIYFSLVIDACTPKVYCTLSLECILNDIIFVYLKVNTNGEAHKCLKKTHLLCACHRTPM